VTGNGAAYCWGDNTYGQLGDGTNTSSLTPVAISGGYAFASVMPGLNDACGVTTAGAAYCWGDNTYGQLGNGTTTNSNVPLAVAGGYTFSGVSLGNSYACGVTTAGAAYCWGYNGDGRLGDGTHTGSNVPVAVAGGHTFTAVSLGRTDDHACGVTTADAAYCWGQGAIGALGNGTNTSSDVPVAVSGGIPSLP
jgi:alpha-tubulin suppressor-like RCC1 family protein